MKKVSAKITGPTYLTIARMLIAILFLTFVLIPETWAKIIALILFIAGAITDKIDGNWARKRKLVTDLGAFLDPLADKMLINLAFLALVAVGVVPVWVFAIILVRDFAVDGMRMMAARDGVTIAASFYGKLKTTVQMTALIILLFNLIANLEFFTVVGNIALYLALALTVFSGGDYLAKGWKQVIR
ncbi:MAG: CDP-diacylglycerol--glycerol-3-phosphate 3-phosphatidyltransferase [Candidatus Saccharimonadaceae bacterium]|nr:CDP-diacylglycerol--glycerol-3-phosphate 3-phosphatidyltransferase [Candidatus Saccharimonadaceae bacterium]